MGFTNWIRSRFFRPGGLQFFTWSGEGCSPGFTVDLRSLYGITAAYNHCSTLKTVVNRNAMAMANGRMWLVDDKDNDVLDSYPDLQRLFAGPNPLQTWSELLIQLDIYRQLYGEAFLYAAVPVGFSAMEASALWVINPQYVEVNTTGKLYNQNSADGIVIRYILTIDGERTEIEPDRMLHIKDVNQNLGFSPTDIRGSSRLEGLDHTIGNIIQAEEAVYAINRDRGAMGILSNDTKDVSGAVPLTDEEKTDLQEQYRKMYGLSARQAKVIITNASMKWQAISFNVKDLMLFEGIEKNIQRIADAMDYPYELLGTVNGVTYENKLEAKRFLYQDTVIPIAKLYGEKLTGFFGLDRAKVLIDFSEVECLKKSEKDAAETLYQKNMALKTAFEKGVISRAEWRLAIGMDEDIYKPDEEPEQEQGNGQNDNDDGDDDKEPENSGEESKQ